MFNQFAPDAKHRSGPELIPANTLAFALVSIQKVAPSNSSGGLQAALELTVNSGPYERRKLFPYVGDPSDAKHSEKWQQMSLAALQHMLEAAGVFDPSKPETYQQFADKSFVDIMRALEGRTVAVKIGIEKGEDGYDDKNVVKDYLSPNPASRSFGKWQQLVSGGGAPTQAPTQTGFSLGGGQPTQAPSQNNAGDPRPAGKPDWL